MTRPVRTSALLAALALGLFSVAAHAGPRTFPVGPVKGGPIQVGPSNAPPPVLGWPHDVRSAISTPCRAAGAGEVILSVPNGPGGGCLSLVPGFYATLNDVSHTWLVTSISVGSGVRARAFFLEHFSQDMDRAFIMYSSNATLPLTGDAQTIRSVRVEPAGRSMICNDVVDGEIALFEGWDGGGDCVVLPVGQYPSADSMGIANDSISGVYNRTTTKAVLFFNASFNKWGADIKPGERVARLPQGGRFSDTIDNQASSMQMLPVN